MSPQQPPYQQYPPQQPRWPGNGGRRSGGYPYPHPTGGYTQHSNAQPQPPVLPPAPKRLRKWPSVAGAVVLLRIIIGSTSKPSRSSTKGTSARRLGRSRCHQSERPPDA